MFGIGEREVIYKIMKRTIKYSIRRMLAVTVMLFVCLVVSKVQVQATEATSEVTAGTTTEVTTEATTEEPKKSLNGWKKVGKKKYYYENGTKVTGWKTIGKYKYYFNKKGVLQTNKMISKNKYVNKKGRLIDKAKIFANGKKGLTKLEKQLKKQISGYSGTYSIYVKNLDTNQYLVINNKKMKPASVIKLFNMGAVYDQISQKKMKETDSVKSNLKSMITVSSNDAHNALLNKLGGGNSYKGITVINNFCKKYGYKDTSSGGTLMPSSYPQTYTGTSSWTTVKDVGHILEDIYRGNLANEKYSKKMLNLLKSQQRKGKIPAGLPKGVKSANKTGEYNSRQHDAAIVFSKEADYVIVIFTEGGNGSIGHIQSLSRKVYNYFN